MDELDSLDKIGHYDRYLMWSVVMSEEIAHYYSGEIEKDRLEQEQFRLEGIRTKRIISRFLTRPGMKIVDIGGGAGFYAFWLQKLGHAVSLLDLTPKNIELANQYASKHQNPLAACEVGTATHLPFPDNYFDVALLLGPLYHLIKEEERIKALQEAKRVLKPNGVLLAATISRYASLIDGLRFDLFADNVFEKMMLHDLKTGVHHNPTNKPEYFTTAFFHTPDEIKREVQKAGLKLEQVLPIEGMGWLVSDLNYKCNDEAYMFKLHQLLDLLEQNETLTPMSPHIMAIAKKP
jgi:ubiquinone/menaquinone biosynthesis C-methylase UbiE